MKKLHPRERLMVYLRIMCGVVAIAGSCTFLALRVYAQQAVIPVITAEDARQDEKLDDLKEFKQNQEGYNKEQGVRYDALDSRLSTVEGVGIGCSAALGALNILTVILHLKKRKDAE